MKNITWKSIGRISVWILALTALIVIFAFASKRQSGMKCKSIKIQLLDSESFITSKQLMHLINKHHQLLYSRIDSLEIDTLENCIRRNPFVDQVTVSVDLGGTLLVKVAQKHPVLLVSPLQGKPYYIDRSGKKMPFAKYDSSHFYLAGGTIHEAFTKVDTLHSTGLKNLFILTQYLNRYKKWKGIARALLLNESGEIEILPLNEPFRILIGDTSDLAEKFQKLDILYTTILPKEGINKYSLINLKYAGQLVCVRKEDSLEINSHNKLSPQ